ncbi:MAG: succinyl-diaminopimelate desuccinylase [Actinomycetota bacterium]|nr:succinyl-diaminopimelate desuccinylase [Actinomycetota bacterium]
MTTVADRLAARAEALMAIPSESRQEEAILTEIRGSLPDTFRVVDEEDSVLLAFPERRPGAPLVILAGHVDTVPLGRIGPGRREGATLHGRGASDMKSGLAVMLQIADSVATTATAATAAAATAAESPQIGSDLDVGLLFFGREELPFAESALVPLFDRRPEIADATLAIVLEPTANRLELGCLGNLNATITFEGEAAHSARPWLGRNAIHAAIAALAPVSDLPARDVEVEGLVYREVASVTTIRGGVATNVVPDHVTAHVNFRYAPTHTPAEAERRLRELLGHPSAVTEIIGNAPPGRPPARNRLVERLRAAGDLVVGPKQAWTPVAEFGLARVDAVNLGPGDPQYAHRDDEQVDVGALVRSYEVLRAFLGTERTR